MTISRLCGDSATLLFTQRRLLTDRLRELVAVCKSEWKHHGPRMAYPQELCAVDLRTQLCQWGRDGYGAVVKDRVNLRLGLA